MIIQLFGVPLYRWRQGFWLLVDQNRTGLRFPLGLRSDNGDKKGFIKNWTLWFRYGHYYSQIGNCLLQGEVEVAALAGLLDCTPEAYGKILVSYGCPFPRTYVDDLQDESTTFSCTDPEAKIRRKCCDRFYDIDRRKHQYLTSSLWIFGFLVFEGWQIVRTPIQRRLIGHSQSSTYFGEVLRGVDFRYFWVCMEAKIGFQEIRACGDGGAMASQAADSSLMPDFRKRLRNALKSAALPDFLYNG
ncbi:hypothetical protein TNCT_580161 [Trichonephila clavata]|uniref:Uncharacterized protein n=1 Tax=Trichonephila clavata TaxID=2740835 RepID=A0A8X6JUB4_TRICU|nr:hypothetical protein TNCT_580161 [Trichonephila clavata]